MLAINRNDPFGLGFEKPKKREPEFEEAWADCPDCGDERRVIFVLKPFKVPDVKCTCGATYDLTGF